MSKMTTEMSRPEADGYRTVQRGEACPKCGEPGVRRVRRFGLLVEVFMVHSTTGSGGFGGCLIEERIERDS